VRSGRRVFGSPEADTLILDKKADVHALFLEPAQFSLPSFPLSSCGKQDVQYVMTGGLHDHKDGSSIGEYLGQHEDYGLGVARDLNFAGCGCLLQELGDMSGRAGMQAHLRQGFHISARWRRVRASKSGLLVNFISRFSVGDPVINLPILLPMLEKLLPCAISIKYLYRIGCER
jgi:hypothetical protein